MEPVDLPTWRSAIRAAGEADESACVGALLANWIPPAAARRRIETAAAALVRDLRTHPEPRLMESFLAEYGLSTQEGVALMCLAEALLRVPDAGTVDALIRDKVSSGDWHHHLGQSGSPLVNASTWALMFTGKVVGWTGAGQDVKAAARTLIRRAGEPVIRRAVAQAMRVMGQQFVLGRNIGEALTRAEEAEGRGYAFSYDMLGEAARTAADASRYFLSYSSAIAAIAARCRNGKARANPGISVKLSALHPRYEQAKRSRVMDELVPRVLALALHAKNACMGFNIDAEEADRLDLSLDVFEAVLGNPDLAGWDGFGIVVQGYGKRSLSVLDWAHALARQLDRRIMVRLVKGAYWDTEVKLAQTLGTPGYPVFTRKAATDASYLACARKLLGMSDRIYAQFATHNAHTVTAITDFAAGADGFEFQRLHGMGEALHERARATHGRAVRIYAPVGIHEDLLAYLVRRLLENGANSSFVHQIMDASIPPETIVRDPFDLLLGLNTFPNPAIPMPSALYAPRRNARGWNLSDPAVSEPLLAAMDRFRTKRWHAGAGPGGVAVLNPAEPADVVGHVVDATAGDLERALAVAAESSWADTPVSRRAACLERAADLMEDNAVELLALGVREAGKTLPDAVAELREAVDFCRYYAVRARTDLQDRLPRGVFACISPWNFPLAIFTGQVVAALVAGNPVLAKPAEQTPLIAARTVSLLHAAGIPPDALQLLPGGGPIIGAALVADTRVAGVCFTGSTATARHIDATMAANLDPAAPLIAETGGVNAMIVDSSALPEQAVRDILASAFQSAGQRCSALRILCVQEEVAPRILEMLRGAMDELSMGDPMNLATDVGPVIDLAARDRIEAHCAEMTARGRLIKRLPGNGRGCFVPPTLLKLESLDELGTEIFGPVLHVVTFRAADLAAVVGRLNAKGFGLTLGLHTRVDARVQEVAAAARVGNLYVNRNQIGAVVGVQPFGGEGLSGTGPKAGGPHYLLRFSRPASEPPAASNPPLAAGAAWTQAAVRQATAAQSAWDRDPDRAGAMMKAADPRLLAAVRSTIERAGSALDAPTQLPGPSGESNRLSLHGRGVVLILGREGRAAALMALVMGNAVLVDRLAADDGLALLFAKLPPGLAQIMDTGQDPSDAVSDPAIDLVVAQGEALSREIRRCLAARRGRIVALVCDSPEPFRFIVERTLSVDVTAAGGNVQLLALADAALATE